MEEIQILYHNNFGISFKWKRNLGKDIHKIQLVFRETGLFLTYEELIQFKNQVKQALLNRKICDSCKSKTNCRSGLLETPFSQVTFAMSLDDLKSLEHLIEGTLFQLDMNFLLRSNQIDHQ